MSLLSIQESPKIRKQEFVDGWLNISDVSHLHEEWGSLLIFVARKMMKDIIANVINEGIVNK